MNTIALARSSNDIRRCHAVMVELRPHLDAAAFVAQVRRQQRESGYRLAYLTEDGVVAAVAGFRITECLAWGKFLYVDDLVTASSLRSRGCGQKLFAWLVERARAAGCAQLHLDSGVQRFGAHRFYLGRRMDITCHHFALEVPPK
jgi:GNAT superfamily N-acetyltransferase